MKNLERFAISLIVASWFAQSPAAQAVDRKDQVVFELSKGLEDPPNFNWYFRAPNGEARRENGAHQAMWEPLFLFNYNTGALDLWLADSLTLNNRAHPTDPDVWTLKVRHDVKWSDGTPFTAEDVVFTATMVLKFDLPALEAVTFRAQVDHVTLVDNWTATFTLRNQNPRFALENFGAPMFGSFLIMPKHIWEPQDFKTTYYDDPTKPDKSVHSFKFSNPIGTGPYKLQKPGTVAANTTASTVAGSTVLTFGDTTGIVVGMTAADITNPNAIANGSIVGSVMATTVTLNSPALKTVGSGDHLLFMSNPANVTWVRDDNWWGAKVDPATHKPVFKPLPEPLELIWQVENGMGNSKNDLIANKIDAARPYALADFTYARSQNPKIVGWDPASPLAWNDPCARQIEINTKSPTNPALSDAKIRQALSLLIDRTKLAHDAYSDTTKASATMFAAYGAMSKFINAVSASDQLKSVADPQGDNLIVGEGYAKDPLDHFYKKGGVPLRRDAARQFKRRHGRRRSQCAERPAQRCRRQGRRRVDSQRRVLGSRRPDRRLRDDLRLDVLRVSRRPVHLDEPLYCRQPHPSRFSQPRLQQHRALGHAGREGVFGHTGGPWQVSVG